MLLNKLMQMLVNFSLPEATQKVFVIFDNIYLHILYIFVNLATRLLVNCYLFIFAKSSAFVISAKLYCAIYSP